MPKQFHVEQALFGYQDGHNLVGASVALAPRVRQFLANVTDGSGPENSDGFEAAYTGLPVPETDYYALFCTWPAPEMPRPGCVWSHVLLLDLADLACIPDLWILREHCQRPAAQSGFSAYEQPLTVFAHDTSHAIGQPEDERRAARVLPVLYGEPEKGVVVLDEAGSNWEVVVFGLWSQQWPRLRRNFSFSTGSLGDRRSAGVAFDLQIAPLNSLRLWGRGKLPTVVLDYSSSPPPPAPPWVSTALNDLRTRSGGPLRKFLFSYGSDVEPPRHAFVRLVEYFAGPPTGEEDDTGGRLVQLASAFPRPPEAFSLKRDRLATLTAKTESTGLDSVWAVVYFLLRAQGAAAFDQVPFDFRPHAGLLWQHKRADVLALIGNLPTTERATNFVQALATVLVPEDIPTLWHEQRAALSRILVSQPGLAAHAAAWAMPKDGQRALWESLLAATSDQHTWALTCGAMLRAQCALAERETVNLAGESLADGLLKWLEDSHLHLPSYSWRDALRVPLASVLHNQILPPPLLALAAWALPPDQARSLPSNRSDVQALARHGLAGVPEPLVLPTLFWLTALGFQTSGEDGLMLLIRAFFPVYGAVARSNYPGEAWELLAPILPEVLVDWDRCRRLRRAMRRWLRDHPQQADAMSRAAPTTEYAQLVQSLR